MDDIELAMSRAQANGEAALAWASQHYPGASPQHRAAFANSVIYLTTGLSGGYGGPSLREHLVAWSLGQVVAASVAGIAIAVVLPSRLPEPGEWELDAALRHAAPLVFGPPEQFAEQLWQIWELEQSFDNDPRDLEFLGVGR